MSTTTPDGGDTSKWPTQEEVRKRHESADGAKLSRDIEHLMAREPASHGGAPPVGQTGSEREAFKAKLDGWICTVMNADYPEDEAAKLDQATDELFAFARTPSAPPQESVGQTGERRSGTGVIVSMDRFGIWMDAFEAMRGLRAEMIPTTTGNGRPTLFISHEGPIVERCAAAIDALHGETVDLRTPPAPPQEAVTGSERDSDPGFSPGYYSGAVERVPIWAASFLAEFHAGDTLTRSDTVRFRMIADGLRTPSAPVAPERVEIPVSIARSITDAPSWLATDPTFGWFRLGHGYAATQTYAIPALSKCTPEELYHAVWAIMRGAGLPDPEAAPVAPERPADLACEKATWAALIDWLTEYDFDVPGTLQVITKRAIELRPQYVVPVAPAGRQDADENGESEFARGYREGLIDADALRAGRQDANKAGTTASGLDTPQTGPSRLEGEVDPLTPPAVVSRQDTAAGERDADADSRDHDDDCSFPDGTENFCACDKVVLFARTEARHHEIAAETLRFAPDRSYHRLRAAMFRDIAARLRSVAGTERERQAAIDATWANVVRQDTATLGFVAALREAIRAEVIAALAAPAPAAAPPTLEDLYEKHGLNAEKEGAAAASRNEAEHLTWLNDPASGREPDWTERAAAPSEPSEDDEWPSGPEWDTRSQVAWCVHNAIGEWDGALEAADHILRLLRASQPVAVAPEPVSLTAALPHARIHVAGTERERLAKIVLRVMNSGWAFDEEPGWDLDDMQRFADNVATAIAALARPVPPDEPDPVCVNCGADPNVAITRAPAPSAAPKEGRAHVFADGYCVRCYVKLDDATEYRPCPAAAPEDT